MPKSPCLRTFIFGVLLFVLSVQPVFAFDDSNLTNPNGFGFPDHTFEQAVVTNRRFGRGAQILGVSAGATHGMKIFGSSERHHLFLGLISYGRIVRDMEGERNLFRGNIELCGELLGGSQFHPENDKLIGFAGHVRYNFINALPLVPFVDVGAGATLTEIREPDLGGAFEFNLQAVAGLDYWFGQSTAMGLELRYVHLSSAGIYSPNRGVNTVGLFVSVKSLF